MADWLHNVQVWQVEEFVTEGGQQDVWDRLKLRLVDWPAALLRGRGNWLSVLSVLKRAIAMRNELVGWGFVPRQSSVSLPRTFGAPVGPG